MTTYTLFGQGLPVSGGGALTSDPNPYTIGTQFSVSEACTLTGVWFYSPVGAGVLPQTIGLYAVSGQSLVHSEAASWSGAAGSEWVRAAFTTPPSLAEGAAYEVVVLQNTNASWYNDPLGYWTSGGPGAAGITNGPLTAPGDAASVGGQCLFTGGTTLTYPATSFEGANFWIDPEVSPGGIIPAFSATFESTDGNGVQSWSVLSALNNTGGAGAQQMRVLPPAAPSNAYPHAFLFLLPVETGQGTTFGDSIATILALGAHNAYNLTCIQPGFPINPWYADNPLDSTTSQESFMAALAAWAATTLQVTGTEKNYLIGFSKSGLGGQGLQLRNPSLYAATASWDAPFLMDTYDGGDPDDPGGVGGGSAAVYGTAASFTAHYELSTGNLAGWKAAANFGSVNRLWIAGYSAFQQDVIDYDTRLTSGGIVHTSGPMISGTHAWDTGWVSEALSAIIPPRPGPLAGCFP